MTVTVAFAGIADGYLQSYNASYATALAGTGTFNVVPSSTANYWGQNNNGGLYTALEAFEAFPYALDSDSLVVGAYIQLAASSALGTSVSRDLEVREYNWGGTLLATTHWRTPAQLAALTLLGKVAGAQASSGGRLRAGSTALLNRLGTTGEVRVVAASSRTRSQSTPTTDEGASFWSADQTGTTWDPALIYTTMPLSTLNRVLGAQVQLSDGTHVFLESTASVLTPTVTLKHRTTGGAVTTVATVATGTAANQFYVGRGSGAQSLALARSPSDNLYVIGRQGSAEGGVLAQAFAKGAGYTWTAKTALAGSLPAYDASASGWAAAWHAPGGTAGTIMCLYARVAGTGHNGQMGYALLNADSLLAGSGSLLRGTGDITALVDPPTTADLVAYHNLTGTGMDVAAVPGFTDRGHIVVYTRAALGENTNYALGRYVLNSGGTGFSSVAKASTAAFSDQWAVRDANSKTRVIAVSDTLFVVVAVDGSTAWGPVVAVFQNIGTSTSITSTATVRLSNEGIASLPAAATLARTAAWDCVYYPPANKLYFYYFDTANPLRLMRTGVDLTTGLADQAEVQISAAVGAAGSANRAIRVQRGTMTRPQVLIAVANRSSGGTHSTIYVTDTLNVAPTQPVLTPKPNFDATTAQTFSWTFTDPDIGDVQSAYQLLIDEVGVGTVHDSGKVTSAVSQRLLPAATLTNGKNYQWRVRTWDGLDVQGPLSADGAFATSAAGNVTVIDPAVDNPAGVITADYLIGWQLTGAVQDSYRVRVVRTVTGAVLVDTGFVAGAATTYLVTGMASDVEYRIEVTTRGAGVDSSTGLRLITPSYGTPEQPSITAGPVDAPGPHILVSVTNPNPPGDIPQVTSNDILRRVAGSSAPYVTVGQAGVNGVFADYTAAAGVTYEYVARGQAPTGFADSVPATAVVAFVGVWIHDPADPPATIRVFRRRQGSGAQLGVEQAGQHYAGRTHPVFDFGEHQTDGLDVEVIVLHRDDADLAALVAFAEARRTLMLRDARARVILGAIAGFTTTDGKSFTLARFTFTRSDD